MSGKRSASEQHATKFRIFEKDEMQLRSIRPEWTVDELLAEEGIFYLKDVASKLDMRLADLKKKASDLEYEGESAWETMGVRKTWSQWIVRMKKFGTFFRENAFPKIKEVDPAWNGNQLLAQKGRFYLSDVCEKIPFTARQIRYQVRRNENAREEFGVWRDEDYKAYIVEMGIFSVWLRRVWNEGMRGG